MVLEAYVEDCEFGVVWVLAVLLLATTLVLELETGAAFETGFVLRACTC